MRTALVFVGAVMAMVSAYFVYVAYSIETAVPSPVSPAGYEGIANLQAMHIQMADIVIAVGSGIAAAVLFGAAAVVGAVEGGRSFNE